MTIAELKYFKVRQKNKSFILTTIRAGTLIDISYVAIRNVNIEPGAVQRLLNPNRISSVKKFTLENGDYPGSIILNWVSRENPMVLGESTLKFNVLPRSAQIIDGQHRLAGIKEAIQDSSDVADIELPVSIYENLDTRSCADIFLSINTEQKPVPRSLVFDLYGIASEPVIDPAALRARDIATFLNEDSESPYVDNIKFPGAPTRKGGIALSTAVTAIKPLVEEKGSFEQVGISELELQKQIVLNFFVSIKSKYGSNWHKPTNAFQYAAGFVGACDFLMLKVLPYCNSIKNYKVQTIQNLLNLDTENLILQSEVKGLGGKDAPKKIYERLLGTMNIPRQDASDIEV